IDAPVILLVVAEEGVETDAAEKIQSFASAFANELQIQVIDSSMVTGLHRLMQQIGYGEMTEGVSLHGYGAIRNVGLMAAILRGFTEVIFIDDDEIVTDPNFVENALHGLGRLSPKGVPILVKSGYYTDARGGWRSLQEDAWYNRFWGQGELLNQWLEKAMSGARLSPSNILNGGCMSLHYEAFTRIAFDAWISRGEDLDYLLNLMMFNGRVWFDSKFSIQRKPPASYAEGQRFRQDIYRWIYEYRKLEYAISRIDLLPIDAASLDPYPGPFLQKTVARRALITALLRTIGNPRDRQGYLKAALAVPRDAQNYALEFSPRYFEFQELWPEMVTAVQQSDEAIALFSGGIAEPLLDEE
ncbi:MAG: hypothetical protein FWD45_05575, partial [Coriobacteriia bacterium]|nr:hypothetical protein [Coriobacteriia bacterium]